VFCNDTRRLISLQKTLRIQIENINLINSISLYNEITLMIHIKKLKDINATDMDDAEGKLNIPCPPTPHKNYYY